MTNGLLRLKLWNEHEVSLDTEKGCCNNSRPSFSQTLDPPSYEIPLIFINFRLSEINILSYYLKSWLSEQWNNLLSGLSERGLFSLPFAAISYKNKLESLAPEWKHISSSSLSRWRSGEISLWMDEIPLKVCCKVLYRDMREARCSKLRHYSSCPHKCPFLWILIYETHFQLPDFSTPLLHIDHLLLFG